jgi:hypothetical protein
VYTEFTSCCRRVAVVPVVNRQLLWKYDLFEEGCGRLAGFGMWGRSLPALAAESVHSERHIGDP